MVCGWCCVASCRVVSCCLPLASFAIASVEKEDEETSGRGRLEESSEQFITLMVFMEFLNCSSGPTHNNDEPAQVIGRLFVMGSRKDSRLRWSACVLVVVLSSANHS